MAKIGTRLLSLILALIFFLTSVGTAVAVIWVMRQDSNTRKEEASAVQKQSESTQKDTSKSKEGKLEGTKLKNFEPVAKVEKLEIIDITPGTGEEVKAGASVVAHYTGALAKDGTIFQSSHDMAGDKPIPFSLAQVVKGWQDGVPGMKVGGTRRILIPADQAYGAQSQPGIPANSDLVFDIEMVSTQNP